MRMRNRVAVEEGPTGPDAALPRLSLASDELFRPRSRRGRAHRIVRRVRRMMAVVVALGGLGLLILGGLFLVTPSAGTARELVRAQARAHRAVYPAPPVPRRFAASLIAVEGHEFGARAGADPMAAARVSLAGLTGGDHSASATIYQQLASLLYASGGSGLAARVERVVLGFKLEHSYSMAGVLRMYAGVAYFGRGYYGLAAASCGYFGEPPARLSWGQAAMLAALVQAPGAADPFGHPARAVAREAHVLSRLVATGALTSAQARAALARPPLRAAARSLHCRRSR